MKLLNYTSAYFAMMMLVVITIWAGIFYINMLDEIYDSIDDGLENSKMLIIARADEDPAVFSRDNFLEANYAIQEIDKEQATDMEDVYMDTTFYMINEEDYEPVRMLKTAFLQDGKYYSLQIVTSMVEEDDLIEDLLYSILWLYLILVAVIILLNNILLKRIWKPFYQLLQNLRKFRLDKSTDIQVMTSPIQEFNELNDALEQLVNRNIDIYNQQKQFIENASHELQTPLAISLNKLEMLLGQENLSETQMGELAGIMTNLERMNRMNRSLLLLSKIDNQQFLESSAVDLNELIEERTADFQPQVTFKNVTIRIDHQAQCILKMHADLASIMVTNLIKNAIVHNVSGGTIQVIIEAHQVSFSNTGKAEALDSEKVFNRFYKTTEKVKSTGLGLAIVRSIVRMYHYDVQYHFDGKHHMTIFFP